MPIPDVLTTVAHRPYPLPSGHWRMAQRWNSLLFAHWPIPVSDMARVLPAGLEADTFGGHAWAGVVPFSMDRVRTCTIGNNSLAIPSTAHFCELNLRTYVRSRTTGLPGVYFFSLDASSPLAVLGARAFFHLPYFLARMNSQNEPDGSIQYRSKRLLTNRSVRFEARYQGSGQISSPTVSGSLEHFLTARYCLFTHHAGRLLVGHIHHLPWPLEPAEAEITVNELPSAHGLKLPPVSPILHFARHLDVYIWSLRPDKNPDQ